jgi:TPR repeat protein
MINKASEIYDKTTKIAQAENPDIAQVLLGLKSAEAQGDLRATYAIATWYLFGKPPVIEQSTEKALELLRVAGRVVADAAFDLAICYETAEGTAKDGLRALRWYMQAALLGRLDAYFEVGRCFYYGIGVKGKKGLAEPWFQKAQELGLYSPEICSTAEPQKPIGAAEYK